MDNYMKKWKDLKFMNKQLSERNKYIMLKIIKYIIVMLLIGIFTTNIMIYKEVSSVKGDLNNDGEVDIVDLLLMKKYLIDKDEQEG